MQENKPKWGTANLNFYHISKTYQKQLKANLTPAEQIMWQVVRNRQLNGAKFRRQHIIDVFIVDFVCLEKKLVVELDGQIHDIQKEYDQQRTLFLNEMSFRVIRFRNEEVLYDLENVKNKIIAAL